MSKTEELPRLLTSGTRARHLTSDDGIRIDGNVYEFQFGGSYPVTVWTAGAQIGYITAYELRFDWPHAVWVPEFLASVASDVPLRLRSTAVEAYRARTDMNASVRAPEGGRHDHK